MSAREALHTALESACGMDIQSTANRLILHIETQRDRMIEGGADSKLAFMGAFAAAKDYMPCGEYAWKLVCQHFNVTGYGRERPKVTARDEDSVRYLQTIFGVRT